MLGKIFKAIFGIKDETATKVELNHPRYCDELRSVLEGDESYTLSELQVKLGKRKGTVYHEMTVLRRGGLVISKQYDKSISANKSRIKK